MALHQERSIFDTHRITTAKRTVIAYVLGPSLLWSPTRIRRALRERGYQFLPSVAAISLFCKRFRLTGKISDASRPGRTCTRLTCHSDAVDAWISDNREITMAEIQVKLRHSYNLNCSFELVRQRVYKLGWRKTKTRYCQLVRNVNKIKRMAFALMCMSTNERFGDVIFTDEASVEITTTGNLRFRRYNESSVSSKIGKPKHPFKVHVWAGISARGATNICIFQGILNSTGYQQILEEHLLPFGRIAFPDGYRLMQDNDPKHTSNSTKEFFKTNGIYHWPTPPESPGMNPIEMVWSLLKRYLAKHIKPRNKDQLVEGICLFWKTATPEMCNAFVSHLFKVVPVVVARNGAASGF